MDISNPDTGHYRNDEHYQFYGEFGEMTEKTGAAVLKIEPQFAVWTTCYQVEGMALQKINKSAYTGYITEAVGKRDQTFRGLADTARALLNYFDPKVKEAANRLQIIFDTYGNIAGKAITEKTGSYENLIEELTGEANIAALRTVMLNEWVDELERNNKDVFRLTRLRDNETAERNPVNVKEARRQVNTAYDAIMKRIGALLIVEGEESEERKALYETFIRRHNTAVARYNNAVATRRGRAGVDTGSDTDTEVAEAGDTTGE